MQSVNCLNCIRLLWFEQRSDLHKLKLCNIWHNVLHKADDDLPA